MPYLVCNRCQFGYDVEAANHGDVCPHCSTKLELRKELYSGYGTEIGELLDRIVGSIGIILGVLCIWAMYVAVKASSFVDMPTYNSYQPPQPKVAFAATLFFIACVTIIASSVGMLQSRGWAHWSIIAMSVLLAPGFAVNAPVASAITILLLNYSVLRLCGAMGCKPVFDSSWILNVCRISLPRPPVMMQPSQPEGGLPIELMPTGEKGSFELWLTKVDFFKFDPPRYLEICRRFGVKDTDSDIDFFQRTRNRENWPFMLCDNLASDDAKNLGELLVQVGVITSFRDGSLCGPDNA